MKYKKLRKENILRVRVSYYELVKLEKYAIKHNTSKSQVIRDYIKRLPAIKLNYDEFSTYYYELFGTDFTEVRVNHNILERNILTLENWLEICLNNKKDELPLDEWQEIAGW